MSPQRFASIKGQHPMWPFNRLVAAFANRGDPLDKHDATRGQLQAVKGPCPCGQHKTPGRDFGFAEYGNGRVMAWSFSGCDVGACLQALGLEREDLRKDPDGNLLASDSLEVWEDPVPLAGVTAALPGFPAEVLPDWVAGEVRAVARFNDTPLDVTGCGALGALSVATAGRVTVDIRGQRETANLYLLSALDSGQRKSAPFNAIITRPLVEAQGELQQRVEAKWADPDKEPPKVRLFTGSPTPEALRDLLSHNGDRGAVISPEGGVFEILAGRYSGGVPDLDLVLCAWNGEPYLADRVSKDVPPMLHPALTLCLTVQPDVLRKMASQESFRARGLLGRILYALPPDVVGTRKNERTPIPVDVHATYTENLRSLLVSLHEADHSFVTLTDPAYKLFHEAELELEPKLAKGSVYGGSDGMREWANKWTGQVLKISAVLNAADSASGVFEAFGGDYQMASRIGEDVMRRALKLGDYFLAHAEATFGLMRVDSRAEDAQSTVDWIKRIDWSAAPYSGHPGIVTRRELAKSVRCLRDLGRCADVMRLLDRHGFVSEFEPRKSSVAYRVHPALLPSETAKVSAVVGTLKNPGSAAENSQVNGSPPPGETADNSCRRLSAVVGAMDPSADTADKVPTRLSAEADLDLAAETPPGEASADTADTSAVSGAADSPPVTERNGQESAEPVSDGRVKVGWQAPEHVLIDRAADLEALLPALLEADAIGLDIETTGLDPLTSDIRTIQLAANGWTLVVDAFKVPAPAIQSVVDHAKTLVIHEGKFDLGHLSNAGIALPADLGARLRDTALASRLLTAGDRTQWNSLGEVAERHMGVKLDKSLQSSGWEGELSEEQLRYAATDAAVLLPLRGQLGNALRQAGLLRVMALENRCLPALVWLEQSGAPFDLTQHAVAADGIDESVTAAAQALEEAVLARVARSADLFGVRSSGVNWDSPAQLQGLLAELGITVPDTSEDTLLQLDDPIARLVLCYREVRKLQSTFGREFARKVAPDGRIHATFRQIGADTGRMSCTDPNLQQVPKAGGYRGMFRAPDGRALIKADYSQIELRLAAEISGDKALIEAFQAGADLHTLTAQRVLGRDQVSKADRQAAKALNFGLLYGMGAPKLRHHAQVNYGVEMTDAEAVTYRGKFFATYKGLRRWHQAAPRNTADTRTLTDRRRLKVERWTERLNTPVQGSGADGLKLALALLFERRDQAPAFPVLTVHDEIVIECATEDAGEGAEWLRGAMVDGMSEILKKIPVVVDTATANDWEGN